LLYKNCQNIVQKQDFLNREVHLSFSTGSVREKKKGERREKKGERRKGGNWKEGGGRREEFEFLRKQGIFLQVE